MVGALRGAHTHRRRQELKELVEQDEERNLLGHEVRAAISVEKTQYLLVAEIEVDAANRKRDVLVAIRDAGSAAVDKSRELYRACRRAIEHDVRQAVVSVNKNRGFLVRTLTSGILRLSASSGPHPIKPHVTRRTQPSRKMRRAMLNMADVDDLMLQFRDAVPTESALGMQWIERINR